MKWILILLITSILLVLLLTNIVFAVSNSFTIPWWTVDGGGALWSAGSSYTVSGTVGQPDAGVNIHRGGAYTIHGGFWQRRENHWYRLYLPLIYSRR